MPKSKLNSIPDQGMRLLLLEDNLDIIKISKLHYRLQNPKFDFFQDRLFSWMVLIEEIVVSWVAK